MAEPVEFRNLYGRSRWQPALDDGDRLFRERDEYGSWTVWEQPAIWRIPVLTSRRRAIRLAAREQRRRDEEFLAGYKEVDGP